MLYLSHSITVLSRWAIMRTEADANLTLIVSWIKASVSRSSEDVASSMINIFEFLSRARPKHKSCFWPTLKFSPSSERVKFKPSWKDNMKSWRWQSFKHFHSCLSVCWFQGSRLNRTVPAKSTGSYFVFVKKFKK